MVRPTSGGVGWIGRLVMVAGALVFAGILWYSRQDRMERRLTSLGGEVYYARGERATLLADRLQRSGSDDVAKAAPRIVDRMFGRLVAVHFGREIDLRGTDPQAVVKAICESPHLRTVVIDGILLRDPHLLVLMDAPALAELGLKNTEVTAEGVQAAKAKRPGVEIQWGAQVQ